MSAISPGVQSTSKTPLMPPIAPDNAWQYSSRREKLKHFIKDPPCVCGAGTKPITFQYENTDTADYNVDSVLPDSLIPDEYKIVKHPGVLGLEFQEDKYTTRTRPHPNHMTVFPSMKPVTRKEIIQLRQTMHSMLDNVTSGKQEDKQLTQKSHLHGFLEIIENEQHVYNTVFHELIRQVSVHCVEQGQLLSELRSCYAELFSRVPAQVKDLHDDLLAQKSLDKKISIELRQFQSRVSSLTDQLSGLKENEVKISHEAVSAKEDLSKALNESEKNSGLLSEYHELYELQRKRLEIATQTSIDEKELWQQTSYDLALRVASDHNLYTVRRLQQSEQIWKQLANRFVMLLTDADAEKISLIHDEIRAWRCELRVVMVELHRREKSIGDTIQSVLTELNEWRDFLLEYLDSDGFRKYPSIDKIRDLWEGLREWEQKLSQEGDFYNGEPLITLQDQFKKVQKRVQTWTEVALKIFQFHPNCLLEDHTQLESTNQNYFLFHKTTSIRISGENGVADELIHVTTPLENWSQKLSLMIQNLEKHIPDPEWVKFQIQLNTWIEQLEIILPILSTDDTTAPDSIIVNYDDVIKQVDKWFNSFIPSLETEDASCGTQISTVHSSLIKFTIQLLLKLTANVKSKILPSAPNPSSNEIKLLFISLKQELETITDKILANCSDLTAEISVKLREAGIVDSDENIRELKHFTDQSKECLSIAQLLTTEIEDIELNRKPPPILEKTFLTDQTSKELGDETSVPLEDRGAEQGAETSVPHEDRGAEQGAGFILDQTTDEIDDSTIEIQAICIDKNSYAVPLDMLTSQVEPPKHVSYLEGVELPPSHALTGIDVQNVVRELANSKESLTTLEEKVTKLELELIASQNSEKQSQENIRVLEEMLEKSKEKEKSTKSGGVSNKPTQKRNPSSGVRSSTITPARTNTPLNK